MIWYSAIVAGKRVVDAITWALRRFRALLLLAAVLSFLLTASRVVEAGRSIKNEVVSQVYLGFDESPSWLLAIGCVASFALLSASVYLPNRAGWNLRISLLRRPISELESSPRVFLDEAEVRRRLQDFSADASELSIIAGKGEFFETDNAQLREAVEFGRRCRVLVARDYSSSEVIRELLSAGVGVRAYASLEQGRRRNGGLRGRLKHSSSGMAACLFDRVGQGYHVVNLANEVLVRLVADEFDRWYGTGLHPLIRHVVFDIAGVAFDGDVSDFFDKVQGSLPTVPLTRATDYLNLNEELSLGKTDILEVVERRLSRQLVPDERKAIVDAWSSTWTLNPSVEALIASLRENGYTVSFCSNCDKHNAEVYELKGYFDRVDERFLSCQMGLVKPDEQFFRAMLSVLDAQPWECVLLDDMKGNVDTAKGLGMHTIFVPRGQGSGAQRAEYMARHLADLAVRGK